MVCSGCSALQGVNPNNKKKKKTPEKTSLDSRNGTFSLADWEFRKYVVTPLISLLANSNNCLGVRFVLRSARWQKLPIFLKYCQNQHRGGGGDTWRSIQEFFYHEGQSSFGSAYMELMAMPRHISKLDNLKECSLGLSQLTCKCYQTYFGSHLAYGLYI